MMIMDSLDVGILRELRENCRLSYRELAKRLGWSAQVIRKRVRQLLNSGIIIQFIVECSLSMIDADPFAAIVSTDGSEDTNGLICDMGSCPLVRDIIKCENQRYFIRGCYIRVGSISKLVNHLRQHVGVTDVKLHTLFKHTGSKINLSKKQQRVIQQLLTNPRMKLTNIAKNAGISVKTVKRALKKILDKHAFSYTIDWNLSAADSIGILTKLKYNEKLVNAEDVLDWVENKYEGSFCEGYISAFDSVIFIFFVTSSLAELMRIAKSIQEPSFIDSAMTLICKIWLIYSDWRKLELEKFFKQSNNHSSMH
jgi:DNA-binding Lrp family transcriptional regulator